MQNQFSLDSLSNSVGSQYRNNEKNRISLILSVRVNQDYTQIVIGTNFGFRVYDPKSFEQQIIKEEQDFELSSGVRIAVPYYSSNIFGLVPLAYSENLKMGNVYLYDDEEKKITNTFTTNSNHEITGCEFFKKKILTTTFDSIEIFCLTSKEPMLFLKTCANVIRNFSSCFIDSTQDTHLAFKSPKQNQIVIYSVSKSLEYTIEGLTNGGQIGNIKLSKSGKLIAISTLSGDYIEVKNTKDGKTRDLFYRGYNPATIHSMVFSPNDQYYAVLSSSNDEERKLRVFKISKEVPLNQSKGLFGFFERGVSSLINLNYQKHFAMINIKRQSDTYQFSDADFRNQDIIHFIEHKITIKNTVQSYENELKLIMDDKSAYNVSFDSKNGGVCEIINSKTNWFFKSENFMNQTQAQSDVLNDLEDKNDVITEEENYQDFSPSISFKKHVLTEVDSEAKQTTAEENNVEEDDDWVYI